MLCEHDQYGELNELAIACYSRKCLLFSCYLIFNNGSKVANAAHNTALFVHFKGQSSIIRSLGAHSHLLENVLDSICSLMVLMVPIEAIPY